MISILSWLGLSAAAMLHPFYISMTDINYNTKTQSLELSVRIFTDDFEKTLRKDCSCKVDLLSPPNRQAMENLVNNYILKHLQIKVNGQPRNAQFTGYQQEEESIWSYFQIKEVSQVKRLDIKNTLLHDYQPEQINMFHITANGKEQSDKLDYPQNEYSIGY